MPSPQLRQKKRYIYFSCPPLQPPPPPFFLHQPTTQSYCVSETNHKLNRISQARLFDSRIYSARKRIDFGKKRGPGPKRFCFVLQLNFSPAIISLSPFCDLVLSPSYRHVIAASFLGQRPRNFAGLSIQNHRITHTTHIHI